MVVACYWSFLLPELALISCTTSFRHWVISSCLTSKTWWKHGPKYTSQPSTRCAAKTGCFPFLFMTRLTCPKWSELAHTWQCVCSTLEQIETSDHGQRMISVTPAAWFYGSRALSGLWCLTGCCFPSSQGRDSGQVRGHGRRSNQSLPEKVLSLPFPSAFTPASDSINMRWKWIQAVIPLGRSLLAA